MTRTHGTAQLIGTRSHQCDATATRATADGGRAFVLCDGIGSDLTVRDWTRHQTRRLATLTARTAQPHEAIACVQTEIQYEIGWEDSVPGACAVAAVTGPDGLLRVAWIGDCRAYLLRPDGGLDRLTTDHNLRAEIEAGGGRNVPRWARNRITRCLGHPSAGGTLVPEWTAVDDWSGCRLLLASDGCYEPIEDAGLDLGADLALFANPVEAAKHLVATAVAAADREHTDNATCLVVDL